MSLSPESKQNRLDELYEYGKSKGMITYKEIMDRVAGMELDADQLDHVLETIPRMIEEIAEKVKGKE